MIHTALGNKEQPLEGIIRVITVIEMITANSFTFRSNVAVWTLLLLPCWIHKLSKIQLARSSRFEAHWIEYMLLLLLLLLIFCLPFYNVHTRTSNVLLHCPMQCSKLNSHWPGHVQAQTHTFATRTHTAHAQQTWRRRTYMRISFITWAFSIKNWYQIINHWYGMYDGWYVNSVRLCM